MEILLKVRRFNPRPVYGLRKTTYEEHGSCVLLAPKINFIVYLPILTMRSQTINL